MLTIQMARSFKVGDTAQVTVNGVDVRLRRTADSLVLLPLDADAPLDERRIVIVSEDEYDARPEALVTYVCSDAAA